MKITNSSPIPIILFFKKSLDIQEKESCFVQSSNLIRLFWQSPIFENNFALFKAFFQLNIKLRFAVEISDKKILIFEKFKSSSFTGKKNQAFWTRIDNFRNHFSTPAYVDVI